jgi:hypothetical protein
VSPTRPHSKADCLFCRIATRAIPSVATDITSRRYITEERLTPAELLPLQDVPHPIISASCTA